MRIGKIQQKILKVLYRAEIKRKKKEKYWFNYNGLRPKEIVEAITKIKYPREEKDYGITQGKKWRRIMIYASAPKGMSREELDRVLAADTMTKKFEEIADRF